MRPMHFLAFGAALCLSGCLDWQGSYTAAARDQCRDIINVDERLDCLRWAAENDTARRAEQRREKSDERARDVVAADEDAITFP